MLNPIKLCGVSLQSVFLVSEIFLTAVSASILPAQCLGGAYRDLSVTLASSTDGRSVLFLPITNYGPERYDHAQFIELESSENVSGNSEGFFPWSYEPACISLQGSQEPICVYTNSSFGRGRGISIFTTPRIAEEFAGLPPFHDAALLENINQPSNLWYTKQIPSKGTGMLAKKDLKRGDLITSYTPILIALIGEKMSSLEREKYLRIAIDQLPPATRDAYLSLSTIYGHANMIVQDVLKANTFEMHIGGVMHLAIFPEPARINHECAPNSQYTIDNINLIHYVYATRPIAANEEITTPYTSPFQSHASRNAHLQQAFHFTCSCPLCSSPEASDETLKQISSMQQTLGDWSPTSKATTKLADQLIGLYESLHLDAFMDTAYGYAALTYSAAGNVKKTKKFSELALEAVAMRLGKSAPDYALWEELRKKPEDHWSWKIRIRS
ncbi:hypothetical protein F5884DRAFT_158077 [Xylogone sp. PMI_703]|nr:hypothetical protein F5884DRAFT_158077 [Xylogone sp. PMI_703]